MEKLLNKTSAYFKAILLTGLLFSTFLIKLPSLYILPFYPSGFLTTQTLAKIVVALIFLFLTMNIKSLKGVKKWTVTALLIYVVTQSASIINSADIMMFLKEYHSVIVSVMIFVSAMYLGRKPLEKMFLKFIATTGAVCVFLDFSFFLFQQKFLDLVRPFIQREIFDPYVYNLSRERLNLYLHTELFIPFFIYLAVQSWTKKKFGQAILFSLMFFMTAFLSFQSNYRTRVVMMVFAVLLTVTIGLKSLLFKRGVMIMALFLSLFIITTVSFSRNLRNFDVIDRFLLQDKTEDEATITYRFQSFDRAVDIFKSSPIVGVGLGNYPLYVDTKYKFNLPTRSEREYFETSVKDPHSILSKLISETGLVGLVGFAFLIGFFAIQDYLYLKRKNNSYFPQGAYIIASWTIFIYGLFNPFNTIFINGWFWFLRGKLQADYSS